MIEYYLRTLKSHNGETYEEVVRASGGMIPMVETNADYRKYLAWVADGNTAEAWNDDAITEPVVEPTTEPETTQPDMEEEI